ncbi:MAG: hypothetical protein ACO1N0_19600 [Fluviicola sp.]
MKPILYFLALSVCLISCKKGKKLKHEVAVQFATVSNADVYPQEYFPLFDPYDIYEIPQSPSYAHDYSNQEIANQFNKDLTAYLKKNNVMLQADTAEYVLYINTMYLSESLERQSYIDSCSWDNSMAYVYKSSLRFLVKATLYKNGIIVDSWEKEANSWESIKNKRDGCNKPIVRGILRGTNSLIQQVAKELRVRISKKMYALEK